MTTKRKPILCLDFDGVLHSYTTPWSGAHNIPDPPVKGAMQFLSRAVTEFEVNVYSSRSGDPEGVSAMRAWLRYHYAEHCRQSGFNAHSARRLAHDFVRDQIKWPTEKPPAITR